MRTAPGGRFLNTAFDPSVCDLSTARFVLVTEIQGEPVAVSAAKKWLTDDYLVDISAERIWLGEDAPLESRMPLAEETKSLPLMKGTVAHFGGLWIHPTRRGTGLSALLPQLMRAVAVQEWQPNWLCGSVMADLAQAGFPKDRYQYAHATQLTREAIHCVTRRPESLVLPWEHVSEWQTRVTEQLSEAKSPIFRLTGPAHHPVQGQQRVG